MQSTSAQLGGGHRKRPSSELEEPLSGPPCKRFQSSLKINPSHSEHDGDGREYAVINEVLKSAHFNSLAMRANSKSYAKR